MEYPMNIDTYLPLLVQGTAVTLTAWILTALVSITIGTLAGIFGCQRFASAGVTALIRLYTFIAKGIPAYVHILIAYFVIPALLGISLSGFAAGCCALALCSSGYVTEIIRAGINTLSSGQWDACFVLGYSRLATLQRIILPQTVVRILPALCGELEQLLKSTSLLATIGVMDITRSGMNIISRELNPLPIYLLIAGVYLIFSAVLQALQCFLEKRMQDGYR